MSLLCAFIWAFGVRFGEDVDVFARVDVGLRFVADWLWKLGSGTWGMVVVLGFVLCVFWGEGGEIATEW